MKKYIALFSVTLILAFCGLFQSLAVAQGQNATPEAATKAFYTWFITQSSKAHAYPLMDKQIYQFVSKSTVDLLRTEYKQNKFADRAEYFTNAQDYDEKDWLSHIVVRPAFMVNDVAIVPVTLGSATDQVSVLAFLRKLDGTWKIIKVGDTQDYENSPQ